MKRTYQTGLDGEKLAAAWLETNRGMKLLESRCRTKAGEIDLVMSEGSWIVFVEVKTRLKAPQGMGLLAVDRRKQQRIGRAAALYLLSKGWQNRAVRFDVVEVTAGKVPHIPNAFQPGGLFYR